MLLELILQVVTNSTSTAIAAAPAHLAPAAPATNSTAGLVPWIQNFATLFATNATAVTLTMDNAAVDVGKAAVVFLVISGVLLWFTRLNRHLGRELVEGGIFIGIFIEFVVPFLMSIHY